MISNAQSKLIRSLRLKKYRDQLRLYMVEGEKMVLELIQGESVGDHMIQQLFATGQWIRQNEKGMLNQKYKVTEASTQELKKLSNLVTPPPVIALVSKPDHRYAVETLFHNTVLAFETIRDPGNLGTIIRTADWFGIDHLICSPDSTDAFNPKVVQATMGAIARVKIHYLDLEELLSNAGMKEKIVYGTFLEGDSIYEITMDKNPLILFGNESHGLSDRYESYIGKKIAIPAFSRTGNGSESLNVASSVAVVCSELRRVG
jgi:TrmH family RNA methyltransferase